MQKDKKLLLLSLSHDIKTPLTVILGYLEIMRLNHADNEMLKKVETKANQVMNLINQFFYISKTGIWRYKYKSWQSQYQRDMQGECFGVL